MLFSPINNKYSLPQRVDGTLTNGKQTSDSKYREVIVPGPIIQSRPFTPINIQGTYCPDLPQPNQTLLAPERDGKHYTQTNYYSQGSQAQGYYYSPYYKLGSYPFSLPEFMLVDTTNINLGYNIGFMGLTLEVRFRAEHIGKLLFRRFDGLTYIDDHPSGGTDGFLGSGPAGVYENGSDSDLGYWMTYRPVYNITQRIPLNDPYLSNSTTYLRFSPAWLWYEFWPSGGGSSFNGTLTAPTWHIGLPGVRPAGDSTYWLTLRTIPSSSGDFTITIDSTTTAPISQAEGASLVSNIQSVLATAGFDMAYITVYLIDLFSTSDYTQTIVSIVFSNVVGSPYRNREIPVALDDTNLVDCILSGYFYQKSFQQEVSELMYFFPTDWYSYTEGQTKEHRKWYPGKPLANYTPIASNIARSGLDVFAGMETQGSPFSLGTFSPYRATTFHPGSFNLVPRDVVPTIVTIESTPTNVRLTQKKISVTPVYL